MSLQPQSTGQAVADDGTPLAWQSFGDGPPVLVANGIGVSWRGMAPQLDALVRSGRRAITWDYRGLFASVPAGRDGLAVPAHAADARRVLDALQVPSAPVVGWSMGVNVAFELAWQTPDRVDALFGIGGVPYSPFRACLGPGIHRVARRATLGMRPAAPLAAPVLRRVLPTEAFFEASRAIRYIRETTDRAAFLAMAGDVASHDLRVYLTTLASLGQHDLRAMLPALDLPVRLLGGGRDALVRPSVMRRVAATIPGAEAHIVPDTSHFLHLESPEAVNALLGDFLARVGSGAAAPTP